MHHSKGFTLIEVLIASVIIFTVMTIMYNGFAQATSSSSKATEKLITQTVLPSTVNLIKQELAGKFMRRKTSGKGDLLGISYEWQAKLMEEKPLVDFSATGQSSTESAAQSKVKLWEVELMLSKDGSSHRYAYLETSW